MTKILFSVPASLETYQGLGNFMHIHGLKEEMYEVVDRAIKEWMDRFVSADSQGHATTLDGYQWKQLFLPEGTTLRTAFKRVNYLAHVEGSEVVYQGRSVSPAQFANEVAGCARNAWKVVWLRFPNEDEWKPAMSLRNKSLGIEIKKVKSRPK